MKMIIIIILMVLGMVLLMNNVKAFVFGTTAKVLGEGITDNGHSFGCGNWTLGGSTQCNENSGIYIETGSSTNSYWNIPLPNLSTNSLGFVVRLSMNTSTYDPNAPSGGQAIMFFNVNGDTSSSTYKIGLFYSNGGLGNGINLRTTDGTDRFFLTSLHNSTYNYTFKFFINNSYEVYINETFKGEANLDVGNTLANITRLTIGTSQNTIDVLGLKQFVIVNGTSLLGDVTAPIIKTGFNTTSPKNAGDFLNFTGNVTDETGLLSANWSINFTTGTVKINYTISGLSSQVSNTTNLIGINAGNVLNFTLYVTDTSNNIKQNSTLLIIIDSIAPLANTTLNLTGINQGNIVNLTANISDETGLSNCQFIINQTISSKQIYNASVSGFNSQCSQNFSISSATGVINFTIIVNDTSNNFVQIDRILSVGDTTPPIISNQSLKSSSLLTTDIFNLTIVASDNSGSIQYCRAEINNTATPINFTMNLIDSATNLYSLSGVANTLFINGLHNNTAISCADGSSNIARDQSNFTFTVSNPPSGGGGSSGGGGGGGGITCPAGLTLNSTGFCVNATTIISEVSNCNYNQICEAKNGEDPFACPTDCKINANYLTCDDPTQNCIFNLFDAKNKAVRIGVIIALGSIMIVALPKDSGIRKIFKKKKQR